MAPTDDDIPSHSCMISVSTLFSCLLDESLLRLANSDSTSSTKMTHGARFLASVNIARAIFCDSP